MLKGDLQITKIEKLMMRDEGILLKLIYVDYQVDETELVKSFYYVSECLGGKLAFAPIGVNLIHNFIIFLHFNFLFPVVFFMEQLLLEEAIFLFFFVL